VAKSKPKSNRGGSRAGAGRKPKATNALREALIAELGGEGELSTETKAAAADFAFRLFDQVMRDERSYGIVVRLDCAREVLNRVWGKPRQAVEVSGKGGGPVNVVVYLPDNGRNRTPGDPPAGRPADDVPVDPR
jgi:hypothetical protein